MQTQWQVQTTDHTKLTQSDSWCDLVLCHQDGHQEFLERIQKQHARKQEVIMR